MSVATIGAVGLTDTDLIIPGVPQIPYALLLTGAGSTTEVIEVRSLQRGGHVYVTRGAFGSLAVAHTAPVVVTLYDPNSGGVGGGGGVTVTDGTTSVAASSIRFPSGTISDSGGGVAGVALIVQQLGPFAINYNTPNLTGALNGGVVLTTLPTGALVLDVMVFVTTLWNGSEGASLYVSVGADSVGATADIIANGQVESADLPAATFQKDLKYGSGTAPQLVRCLAGAKLIAWINVDPSVATAGHANIYAIIAVPAS